MRLPWTIWIRIWKDRNSWFKGSKDNVTLLMWAYWLDWCVLSKQNRPALIWDLCTLVIITMYMFFAPYCSLCWASCEYGTMQYEKSISSLLVWKAFSISWWYFKYVFKNYGMEISTPKFINKNIAILIGIKFSLHVVFIFFKKSLVHYISCQSM